MPLDGRNWKQDTETKPDLSKPSLEGFVAWLETMPPNGQYEFVACDGTCLIGLYATAIGHPKWIDIHTALLPHPHDCPEMYVYDFGQLACGFPRTFGAALSRARALLAETRK